MSLRQLLTLAATLLVFTSAVADSPAPRIDPADMAKIMLVKDVKPGMKGYGKTVFRGTKIETFQVEVLGVLKKANSGTDLVLVKMSGGPMTERGANLIQGMSGSPIYINGKLLGAFAYGESFVKEPIGMVTPIEYMLDSWDPKLPAAPSSFASFSAQLDKPIALGGKVYRNVSIGGQGGPDTLSFKPLLTPLLVSGISPRLLPKLAEKMQAYNLVPMAGPGPAAPGTLSPELVPGASVGCSLVTGDLDLTGIGTVTYRRGNKLLAFGHPMMGLGALDAPMCTAYVYDVSPNYYVSSKMAGPIATVGRIFQDRPWSIGGEIGTRSKMLPLTVHVNDLSLGRKNDFNVQILNHPDLATIFTIISASESIYRVRPTPQDVTARVKFRITTDELGVIERENTFFDPYFVDFAAVSELWEMLDLLQMNPFGPVKVQKIEAWVDLESARKTAKIERIFLAKGKFEPGETVEIGVLLRPFAGERITRNLSLTLPKNMPAGRMQVEVSGGTIPGSDEGMMSMMMMELMGGGEKKSTVENASQLVREFLKRDKSNELIAKITLPKPVLSIGGEKLSNLPPSLASEMKSAKTTGLGSDRDEVKEALPTDWVVQGVEKLSIQISKSDKSEKAVKKSEESEPSTDDEGLGEPGIDESIGYPYIAYAEAPDIVTPPEPEVQSDSGDSADESSVDEPAETESEDSSAEAKTVARAPKVWRQTSQAEFAAGTLTNTAASTGDALTLSASLSPLCKSGETYIWSLLKDAEGNLYAGSGNHGIVYKIAPDGTAEELLDTPELAVYSLAMDSEGNLYAGTSPNGMVYKIAPDGESEVLYDADEKYITALAADSVGNVYAATGDACKVYKIAPDGTATTALSTSENHALALAVDGEDNLYVGTGTNGIIYELTPAGGVSVLYDAKEDSVTALAIDAEGALWAGTSPKGVVYKLVPGKAVKSVYSKAGKGINGITADSGCIYAASADTILKIAPDETVAVLRGTDDPQYISVACGDGLLYAGSAGAGTVYSAGTAEEGTYESPVHDCGLDSRWGVMTWTAELPEGASASFDTRTGNVSQPDATWSDWTTVGSVPGFSVASPEGRYIQYRATLRGEGAKVKDVSLAYLPANQAPTVKFESPKEGLKWSKKQTVKWTGGDPDKDTLSYELFYSADNGATWSPLLDGIKESEPSAKTEKAPSESAATPEFSKDDALAQLKAELDADEEIPEDMKEMILAQATQMVESGDFDPSELSGETPSAPTEEPASATKESSFDWDTAKIADGSYLLKVTVTDEASNPADALTDEAVSEPVTVCNTAPLVRAFKKTLVVEDGKASVEGVAQSGLVPISGVQYRIDSGAWAAALAGDRIFDQPFETFNITTKQLAKGKHTLEVQVADEAGNTASTKLTVTVE
ncbi:MAG: SpoIVB peptidase S55 domain-containing protein [Armatimonadota bacterium]